MLSNDPMPFSGGRNDGWNHSQRYGGSARQTTFTSAELFLSPFFLVCCPPRDIEGWTVGSGSHLDRTLFHSIVSFLTAWCGNFFCRSNTLWRSLLFFNNPETSCWNCGIGRLLDFYAALICWLITSRLISTYKYWLVVKYIHSLHFFTVIYFFFLDSIFFSVAP